MKKESSRGEREWKNLGVNKNIMAFFSGGLSSLIT